MKKINLLLIGLLISISAIGQDIKIGYTNVEYILSFLPETKQVQSEVQAYGTQLQNQLQSKITDFQSKADVFQKIYLASPKPDFHLPLSFIIRRHVRFKLPF